MFGGCLVAKPWNPKQFEINTNLEAESEIISFHLHSFWLGHSSTGTHLLSSVSITCPPGQPQPMTHTGTQNKSAVSQVKLQGLAHSEYT